VVVEEDAVIAPLAVVVADVALLVTVVAPVEMALDDASEKKTL